MPDLAYPAPHRLDGQIPAALNRIPNDLIALFSRISIAAVFWQSGQTKVDGWVLFDNTLYLFENEHKLPLIAPWNAAHLAALAKHLFSALQAVSRRWPSRHDVMIQVFVHPGAWPKHGTRAAGLLFIVGLR